MASSSQVATSGAIVDVNAELRRRHEQWMTQYGRVYGDENEKEKRFQIFKENVALIEAFNNVEENTFELRVNQFADLTHKEFMATYTGGHRTTTKVSYPTA